MKITELDHADGTHSVTVGDKPLLCTGFAGMTGATAAAAFRSHAGDLG